MVPANGNPWLTAVNAICQSAKIAWDQDSLLQEADFLLAAPLLGRGLAPSGAAATLLLRAGLATKRRCKLSSTI